MAPSCATVRRITVTPSNDTEAPPRDDTIHVSCAAYLTANPGAPDGIYTIDPDGPAGALAPFPVYCVMTTDGGGWTRVVNIKSGSVFHADNPNAVGAVGEVARIGAAIIHQPAELFARLVQPTLTIRPKGTAKEVLSLLPRHVPRTSEARSSHSQPPFRGKP